MSYHAQPNTVNIGASAEQRYADWRMLRSDEWKPPFSVLTAVSASAMTMSGSAHYVPTERHDGRGDGRWRNATTAVAMVMAGSVRSAHRSESVTLALKSARLPTSK